MKIGKKQALSQPITASTISRTVTGKSDSNMLNNSLLFLSETTPPTPPDTVLHSCAHNVVTCTQQTLCVYALVLVGITHFPQFTKNMDSMSRGKCEKIRNTVKIRIITYFLGHSFIA
jgi:hypothetical protein